MYKKERNKALQEMQWENNHTIFTPYCLLFTFKSMNVTYMLNTIKWLLLTFYMLNTIKCVIWVFQSHTKQLYRTTLRPKYNKYGKFVFFNLPPHNVKTFICHKVTKHNLIKQKLKPSPQNNAFCPYRWLRMRQVYSLNQQDPESIKLVIIIIPWII